MIDDAEAFFLVTSPHQEEGDDVQLFDLFVQQELFDLKSVKNGVGDEIFKRWSRSM